MLPSNGNLVTVSVFTLCDEHWENSYDSIAVQMGQSVASHLAWFLIGVLLDWILFNSPNSSFGHFNFSSIRSSSSLDSGVNPTLVIFSEPVLTNKVDD